MRLFVIATVVGFAVLLALIWTTYGSMVIAHSGGANIRTACALSLASFTTAALTAAVVVGIEKAP